MKRSAAIALMVILGCNTTRRLTVVADAVVENYAASEVSATLRRRQELIVTLTDPDSELLLGGRDSAAVGCLARLAAHSYGDTAEVKRVRYA